MAKLITHDKSLTREEIADRRFKENLALTPHQRIKKMFALMELAAKFKKGPLKIPQGKGIIFRKKSS